MPIAPVVVGTKILGTKGNEIIAEVNALRVDVDAAEALVHARTDAIGARNAHTYNPGQLVAQGGSCQFDEEQFRAGISVSGDYSSWDVLTAGAYAISWGVQVSASVGRTYLMVEGYRFATAEILSDGWSYGTCVPRLSVGDTIVVRCDAGTTVPYLDGFIHITRVGE
jgi:hypothetical protein